MQLENVLIFNLREEEVHKMFPKVGSFRAIFRPSDPLKVPLYYKRSTFKGGFVFALSKLRYVLGAQDIPDNLQKDFNNLIADYLWKDIYQVQLNVLHESYETGLISSKILN